MEYLNNLIKSYEKWVAANPETIGDVETAAKWISYFVAGRISDSSLVSELIYSLSNIMVFYNDRIIDKENNAAKTMMHYDLQSNNSLCYRIQVLLTTLEYSEVFIEISAKRIFGGRGKWIFVVFLQMFKAAGRFFILRQSTENIITTPSIPSLNRRAFGKQQKNSMNTTAQAANNSTGDANIDNVEPTPALASFTFRLRRSGRVVRKVEGAPPLQYRDFKLHQEVTNAWTINSCKSGLPRALLQAEYLYIAKPLIHLASMGIFGGKRQWQQYVVALMLDLYSIRVYYKHRHLMNKQQKFELSRRCVNLLFYMMRSPFYERYTQNRLQRLLAALTHNVPFIHMITNPLSDYIPHWQSTYFYLWST